MMKNVWEKKNLGICIRGAPHDRLLPFLLLHKFSNILDLFAYFCLHAF